VNQGLLGEIGDTGSRRSRVRYGVTEKGRSVLTYLDGARDLIDIEDVLTKDETPFFISVSPYTETAFSYAKILNFFNERLVYKNFDSLFGSLLN